MASETIYLSGTVRWCKPRKIDKFGKYTVDFFPDKPSAKEIKKADMNLKAHTDDKLGTFYKIKRDHKKLIKDQEVTFGPVMVVKVTGKVLENGVPEVEKFDGLIGDGSKVTIKVVVYDAGPHKGHRWEGLRIDELVEYDPKKEQTPEYPF